ncbi:putative metallo-hydrolase oxidoreductase protein [Phaeoacremonium minimum UCRPA7]|uniref:Putative metallo-hydrolase oxidoreductase protein n=1 Tax=Phaeoacremonium minimum (strain UCR-PA7) TaxID=1286976 RepID=R8BEU8_PHAM7|nr:putative metallo-hydrolase oxidoreductase protein [Phaeoacremonium minimum UCRPA7]EON97824.1 putative metallo-hydrolase oxidoreductase protein [Phaeoacremonium minimum UCRPA7]
MQRLSIRLRAAHIRASPVTITRSLPIAYQVRRNYYPTAAAQASSAPKEAEEASADSGGSRSKDAAESASASSSQGDAVPVADVPDQLAHGGAKGATGGGEPLESSKNAPPQPKITNASIPQGGEKLTKEQQEEVDEHNRDFEAKHDRAAPASDDKVDSKFWSGKGSQKSKD